MQVFRYVMMFRHRGDQQFKLPNGYCATSDDPEVGDSDV